MDMFLLLVILFNLTLYLEASRTNGNSSGHHHNVWKRRAQRSGYLGYDDDSSKKVVLTLPPPAPATPPPRPAENGGLTQVLLIGGGETDTNVEAIDVRQAPDVVRTRPNLALTHMPIQWASVGTFIDNTVLVCGGQTIGVENDCYTYNRDSNTWSKFMYSMGTRRMFAAAVHLSPTQWWVTGGALDDTEFGIASTEVFTVGQGFSKYVDLPEKSVKHCMLKVDSSRFILAGNVNPWMFNANSATWQKLPVMPGTVGSLAGIATLPDGRKELVIASDVMGDAVQVLSLDTLTWRRGGDFPGSTKPKWPVSLPYSDSFLVLGGYGFDTIYRYNVQSGSFDKLRQKLMTPRHMFTAIAVPGDLL